MMMIKRGRLKEYELITLLNNLQATLLSIILRMRNRIKKMKIRKAAHFLQQRNLPSLHLPLLRNEEVR